MRLSLKAFETVIWLDKPGTMDENEPILKGACVDNVLLKDGPFLKLCKEDIPRPILPINIINPHTGLSWQVYLEHRLSTQAFFD